MPKITHHLKDGTVLDSIAGHVVRYDDCPDAYRILRRQIEQENRDEN